MLTRKQKAEQQKAQEAEKSPKKTKRENEKDQNGKKEGKLSSSVAAEFDEFCKAAREHLSIEQMREILEANGQDPTGVDDAVVPRWLVHFFFSSRVLWWYAFES